MEKAIKAAREADDSTAMRHLNEAQIDIDEVVSITAIILLASSTFINYLQAERLGLKFVQLCGTCLFVLKWNVWLF